jgi:hypothetical protein
MGIINATPNETIVRWGNRDSEFSGVNAPDVSMGTLLAGESTTTTPAFMGTLEAGYPEVRGVVVAATATTAPINFGITLRRLKIYNDAAYVAWIAFGVDAVAGTPGTPSAYIGVPPKTSLDITKYAVAATKQVNVILTAGGTGNVYFTAEGQ